MTPSAVLPEAPRLAGPRQRAGDVLFKRLLMGFGLAVVVLCAAVAWQLWTNSQHTWKALGPGFLVSKDWNPVTDEYGALPFIWGTLVSSALALLIAVPLGVGSAVFLTELAPRRIADACIFLIELLAAVPSVILGLIGIFVLVPLMRSVTPYGVSMLTAGVILSIMVIPYITVITREVLLTVPTPLKEGMLALGATQWETVSKVSLPFAKTGIMGAVFLSLGRALGETMAVTMVIGNTTNISAKITEPGYSMAAVIANELAEASTDEHLSALIAIGLSLFALTIIVNGLARLLIPRKA